MTHIMINNSRGINSKVKTRVKTRTNFKSDFNEKLGLLALEHPYIAYITMTICLPILMLLAIALSTTAIMLPISLLFGLI